MSEFFSVKPATNDDVVRLRRHTGLGMHEARREVERNNLEAAIHQAKDIEDLKVCLLSLLHRVR